MRKTWLASLTLLPVASLACTADNEPTDDAESTSSAFTPQVVDCTLVHNGGAVTLSCGRTSYRKSMFEWERLNPLTGSFEKIGAFYTMYSGDVVLRDEHPGPSPVYQLRNRTEWYLPKGATGIDSARFVPTTDVGGAATPLPAAGCTIKRLGCASDWVEVRCTGGPGASYQVSTIGASTILTLERGSGSIVKQAPERGVNITTGAPSYLPVVPPGATLKPDGTLSIPKCFVTGPRLP